METNMAIHKTAAKHAAAYPIKGFPMHDHSRPLR